MATNDISFRNDQPLVSVIIPLYNGERFIAEAINSIQLQSYTNFEILVIDDQSSDRSAEIVNDLSRKDTRITYSSIPHSGSPAAPKNHGLKIARGSYVSFLDHDDLYLPNRLEEMVKGLENNPNWIAAFHDVQMFHIGATPIGPSRIARLHFIAESERFIEDRGNNWYDCGERLYSFMATRHHLIHTSSIMLAISRLDCAQIFFDPSYEPAADVDLWFRLATMGRMGYMDRILSSYRRHEGNITNNDIQILKAEIKVHYNHISLLRPLISDSEMRGYRSRVARLLSDLGYFYSHADNLVEARNSYKKAMALNPLNGYRLNLYKNMLPKFVLHFLRFVNSFFTR